MESQERSEIELASKRQEFRLHLTISELIKINIANFEITCRPRLYIFNSISPVKRASNTLLAMSGEEERIEERWKWKDNVKREILELQSE